MMERRDREALDRHITGNYGEDQFRDQPDEEVQPCGCPTGSHWPECPMGHAPDTTNILFLGSQGERGVAALLGGRLGTGLSWPEAVNVAAWLVVLAEGQPGYGSTFHTFEDTLKAIKAI